MPREINLAGYDLIKEFEQGPNGGPALVPYYCPAGKLTNGWGNTTDVQPGVAITIGRADADLNRNLDWAEACVEKYAKDANANEFSAMVSMCFNVGGDPAKGWPSSTQLRLHNKGDKIGSAGAFANWNKAVVGGVLQPLAGLTRRRGREADLYLTPVKTSTPAPLMPQAVAPEKSAATSKTVLTGTAGGIAAAGALADQAQPAIGAVQNAVTAATSAATSLGGLKAGLLSLVDGRALPAILTAVAIGCIIFFVVRYVIKKRRGEVVSS